MAYKEVGFKRVDSKTACICTITRLTIKIMTGKIKNLNDRGFGFITEDGAQAGAKDIFFHSENVVGTTFNELREGDAVSFEMQSGPKGPFAANVTLVSAEAAA